MSLKKGLVLDLDISSEGLQGTTKFKDKTPYENNGTLSNVTLTTDHKGKANSAGLFNGTDSYIDCGNDVRPTSAISVEAWLKPNNFITNGSAISSGRRGGILLFYPSGGNVSFYVYTGSWNHVSIPQTSISLDTWSHFVLTYDQTNIKIFMNGDEKDSSSLSGSITYDGTPLMIGGYVSAVVPNKPSSYFAGSIERPKIWNRALSDDEIKLLYESYNPCLKLYGGD